MTADARGAPPSPSTSTTRQTHPTQSLRNAWALMLENSVVMDAEDDRSLDSRSRLRLAGFQFLVRRYVQQIRYGCDNSACTTPSCFSCVTRFSNKPFRRPSPLTARAVAYHLASQDDPTAGLCNITDMSWQSKNAAEVQVEATNIAERKIDPRSLSQNLFSTRIARTLETARTLAQEGEADDRSSERIRVVATDDHGVSKKGAPARPTPAGSSCPIQDKNELNGRPVIPNGIHTDSSQHAASEVSPPLSPEEGDRQDLGESHPSENGQPVPNGNARNHPDSAKTPNGDLRGSRKDHTSTVKAERPVQKLRVPVTTEPPQPARSRADQNIFFSSHLSCKIMEELKRLAMADGSIPDTRTRDCILEPPGAVLKLGPKTGRWCYVDECLYQCLSNPKLLLKSFREKKTPWSQRKTPLAHLDAWEMEHAFRSWQPINGSLVFDSLWHSLGCLFTPPPELKIRKSTKGKHTMSKHPDMPGLRNGDDQPEYVSDEDAAHIIMICIHALTSLVTRGKPDAWKYVRSLRPLGWISPNDTQNTADNQTTVPYTPMWLMITDQLEYEPAIRLAMRLVRAIASRRCFSEILRKTSKTHKGSSDWVMTIVYKHLVDCEAYRRLGLLRAEWDEEKISDTWSNWTIAGTFVEWLKTVIMKEWSGQHELNRWDAVGAATEILGDLYEYTNLKLYRQTFELPYLKCQLDAVELINSYTDRKNDPNLRHILQFPFLFPSIVLVQYFRALNFSSMSKHFTRAGNNFHLQDRFGRHFLSDLWREYLEQHYTIASSRYLSLDLRRSHVLEDTLDQLWGLEKRQLLLPFKVRMGKLEGEQGVDQGGVAQEFFRVALAEAVNPDNGMFTVDSQTRMTWFQPFSLEPLSRFELIGLLFSIAIYNGITLPVTFPGALYRRLLGKSVSSHHLNDGWPDLAKSFNFLLKCDDEVGDLLSRGYEFSFETRGLIVNVNMAALKEDSDAPSPYTLLDYTDPDPTTTANPVVNWPPGPEAPLVTNANREAFVQDYVSWLTDKSVRPQFDAFARGFRTCLPSAHLSLLRPSMLRHIIEGSTHIDTYALERVARYDGGFSPEHPFVRIFWAVVHSWSQDKKRKLLEFVTASDRVPVGGIESVVFWVQRNGPEGESLPTSSTCFGRLLLPEYGSKEKLEAKLEIALENARGFGAA